MARRDSDPGYNARLILYLRGLSTGDFRPALEGLLGEDAAGLSATTVSRLCKEWEAHHDRFRQRLLSFNRYAYLFIDGIHVQVRLGEDPKVCLLIVIGVREDSVEELLAVEDGYRESTESWAGVFRDLKRRGLNEPKLVVGDGALGAWAALRDVFPGAGEQRCWFHASGNVIDALPKRLQPRDPGDMRSNRQPCAGMTGRALIQAAIAWSTSRSAGTARRRPRRPYPTVTHHEVEYGDLSPQPPVGCAAALVMSAISSAQASARRSPGGAEHVKRREVALGGAGALVGHPQQPRECWVLSACGSPRATVPPRRYRPGSTPSSRLSVSSAERCWAIVAGDRRDGDAIRRCPQTRFTKPAPASRFLLMHYV